MRLLNASINRFNGIEVDPASLPGTTEQFDTDLRHSLSVWKEAGRGIIWLPIPVHQSCLIPVAVEAGFVFHHTGDDYLMLTCALRSPSHVPGHATHYIGAGGVVVNAAAELLVVVERYQRNPAQVPRYKLPGGALHPGEHLATAVVRETAEETGIQTEFQSVVCMRHWHGYRFGKSDIYIVCRLHPLTHEIRRQEEEIAECRWMPLDEYLEHEHVSAFNQHVVRAALEGQGLALECVPGYEDPEQFEILTAGAGLQA